MKNFFALLLATVLTINVMQAQTINQSSVSPFLFSVNTLTSTAPKWNINYTGSYGQRTSGPFGYDGLDQKFAVKGYLGNRFTLHANAALGFARSGGVNSAQQAEVIRDFLGGKREFGPKLGFGLGLSRDWDGVGALFSRIATAWNTNKWRLGGNMLFEKAFSNSRDKIDFTTSAGFQHRLFDGFFAGVEAIGQDLEGFWEEDEAEGGAKLLIGPSLNYAPSNSKLAFSLAGGPVFYATRSDVVASNAIRDLDIQNGYTVRAMVSFNLQK